MDWIVERAIAHRGLHNKGSIPENSISAFAAAIAENCPIELDIQLLADGEVAVFHDKTLDRLTGESGKIADQTLATIHHCKLLGTQQYIPSLRETLKFINGRVPLLIEIKNEGRVGSLERSLLKTLDGYQGEFAVQSFNPYSLAWFKKRAPHIRRGQLASSFKGEAVPWYQRALLGNLIFNGASAPHFIAYDLKGLPNLPTTLARHLFRRPLLTWTVRSEADRQKALQVADNYIFDPF